MPSLFVLSPPPGHMSLPEPCFGRPSALHDQKGREEIRLACLTGMRAARSRAAAPAPRTARMKSAVFLPVCPSSRTTGRCTPTQMEKLAWVSVAFARFFLQLFADCACCTCVSYQVLIFFSCAPLKRLAKCVEWSASAMLFTPKQRGSAVSPAPEVIPRTRKKPAYWPDFRYHGLCLNSNIRRFTIDFVY